MQVRDANDYSAFDVDLLFEKKLGESVLDLEGAFCKFNGDYERTEGAWFGVASVLLPGGTLQRNESSWSGGARRSSRH
jgi:hypothetical protein